jgi:hypothetical protein
LFINLTFTVGKVHHVLQGWGWGWGGGGVSVNLVGGVRADRLGKVQTVDGREVHTPSAGGSTCCMQCPSLDGAEGEPSSCMSSSSMDESGVAPSPCMSEMFMYGAAAAGAPKSDVSVGRLRISEASSASGRLCGETPAISCAGEEFSTTCRGGGEVRCELWERRSACVLL